MLLLHFGLTYRLWHRVPLLAPLCWGNFGVTMFFTVSGFLIAGNEIRRRGRLASIRPRAFYARRLSRIAPCLILAVAIIVPLGALGIPSFRSDGASPGLLLAEGAATVLAITHNLFMQARGYTNYCLDIYWSLSIEETFYLAFPLLCLALRRDRAIAIACAALIVAAPLVRRAAGDDDTIFLCGDFACFDAIAFGVLAALAASRITPRGPAALVLTGAGAVLIMTVWARGFGSGHTVFSFSAIAAGTAAILLGSGGAPAPRALDAAPLRTLRWLGGRSYELYLFHIILLAAMRDLLPNASMPGWLVLPWLLLFLAGSLAIAHAAARWIGDPANAWLRKALGRDATRISSFSEEKEAKRLLSVLSFRGRDVLEPTNTKS